MFTQTQLQALNAAALAEPSMAAYIAAGNDVAVADWFNTGTLYVVWRTSVAKKEYQSAISAIGTSFSWSGTGGYIARSQGERDAWNTLFPDGFVDPSKLNVRNAFNDIFSGTGAGAINNRDHLVSLSKRNATNAEKALATGLGTTLSPGELTWEGYISSDDVSYILRG